MGSGGTRRLVIMRHAKAEATAPSDHERALASRGNTDAEAAGRWLGEQGITPDVEVAPDETGGSADAQLDRAVEVVLSR